jgi:hypothetical protein
MLREAGGHEHAAYPELRAASSAERRNGRTLLRAVREAARERFPTLAAARAAGYRRGPRSSYIGMELGDAPNPFVHYRHSGYAADDRVLDPRRPESLVYWERPGSTPVLVGYMFRSSALAPPPDPHGVGALLNWHAHAACDARREAGNPLQYRAAACPSGWAHHGDTQMTHVWLTDDLRAGFAGAVPVRELGIFIAGIPALYGPGGGHAAHGHDHRRGGRGHEHSVSLSPAQAAVANAWLVSLLAPMGAMLLFVRGPRRQAALRLLGILGLAGVAIAHALDLGSHAEHAPYLAVLFCALIATCALLALALAAGWRPAVAWSAAVAVCAGAIGGYVTSRTVGLPQIADHVGDWGEPAAIAALVFEVSVASLGLAALRGRRESRSSGRGAARRAA